MHPVLPPALSHPVAPNWWQRNWKWFVPVAALTGVLMIGGFIALIITLVFGMMKSSDAYRHALARAEADPVVQQTLGMPIKPGFFVTGKIEVTGSSGSAALSIPISGPSGDARINLRARKKSGEWTYSTLLVAFADGSELDLLTRESNAAGNIATELETSD